MSPTMYWNRAAKSFHPDSLKSRVSFDLAAASPLFLRNSSELIGVRPIPRTSNCGFMQPSHARLYRPGISFRFVRSPEAPKIIRTHESPVGSGSCDNFSRGLAWIMVDMIGSSSRCTNIAFESESGRYLLPRAPLSIVAGSLARALSHMNDNPTVFEAHFIHQRFHQVNPTTMNGSMVLGIRRVGYRINVKSLSL